ncbi:spore germination protein [Bacillus sp. SD075]|uniref:spore germination protein n=1 Tax=Bacillus sp. SD075 TaxID=2781732 RepID=UPI001A9577C0|nr:spore germination protein [Bacillus sp. SD075]MBO0999654.1 spore germination protein [Bacillus sp. SD075]
MLHSIIQSILQKIKRDTKKLQKEKLLNNSILFSTDVHKNEEKLKQLLESSEDILFHDFIIPLHDGRTLKALLVIVDGLVDEDAIRNNVLEPLTKVSLEISKGEELKQVKERISIFNIKMQDNLEKAVFQILKGNTLLLLDGYSDGLLLNAPGYEVRAISEPLTDRSVRGAHDGFIESSPTNIALIRRRIPHPSLQFETIKIGEYSQTDITIGYVKGIAEPKLIERVKQRLDKIKVDEINNSGDIEQYIEDHPFSIFPTIGNTERPDKTSALLMEGRIVIIINGDPVSLFVPSLFLENMKSIEDYSTRPYYSSFIRMLRFVSFIISISLPALYISAINFHKVMIPSEMMVSFIQARETVPFPLTMEVIMMILMFEVVREAGVRLPQHIGAALSIVGALILGQVSVSAGLVGAPTIVVVSISYITAFIITPIADVTALLRIGLFIASSLFGGYGLILAIIGLLTHMISLTSLGIPYMAPFAPFYFQDWKDSLIRLPLRWNKQRPKSIPNQRTTRIRTLPKTGDK